MAKLIDTMWVEVISWDECLGTGLEQPGPLDRARDVEDLS